MSENANAMNSDSYAERLVGVLKLFAEGPEVLSISEISEALQLAPSSTHRILAPLVEQGLIARAPKRRYCVGAEFFRISSLVETRYGLITVAKPLVAETASESKETCLLAIVNSSRNRMVLAHKVDAEDPLRFRFDLLINISPIWGSMGRAIMAWLTPNELRRILGEGSPSPLTGEPVPDMETLSAELEIVRRLGYARSVGQRASPDAIGVSAPIFDAMGLVCGSLGVVTPKHRMSPDSERPVSQLVRSNAAKLSQMMGHSRRMLDVSPRARNSHRTTRQVRKPNEISL